MKLLKMSSRGFPWGPVVKTGRLQCSGRVWPLIRELRDNMPQGTAAECFIIVHVKMIGWKTWSIWPKRKWEEVQLTIPCRDKRVVCDTVYCTARSLLPCVYFFVVVFAFHWLPLEMHVLIGTNWTIWRCIQREFIVSLSSCSPFPSFWDNQGG